MKKTSLIALALAATLILGGGGVFAAGQIARSNAISEENARNFAYVDAGVLPEKAEYVSTKFDFSKGRFVYEIEFIAEGMHYEYTLDSVTGAVIEKEKAVVQNYSARHTEPASAQTLPMPETLPAQAAAETTAAQLIDLAQAKELVLKDLKLAESDVTILEAGLERDNGQQVYEIELKDAAGSTHEYKLDAHSGVILKESHKTGAAVSGTRPAVAVATETTGPSERPGKQDSSQPSSQKESSVQQTSAARPSATLPAQTQATQAQTTQAQATLPQATQPQATQAPATQAQATQPKATQPQATQAPATQPQATQTPATQPQATQPQATQTPATQAQATQPKATQAPTTQPQATQPQAIGVEAAKAIALKDAGMTADRVIFTKALQDKEDGKLVYDIEFFESGQMEYEYEIDAYTGAILEKDVEPTDALKAAVRASQEAAEAARKAAEEAARKASEEAAKKAAEEAARKASEAAAAQASAKAAEEAAKKASEEAARKASEAAAEAARKASEEAARKASEEAAKRAAEEAARKAAEAAAASSAAASTQPQVISVDKAKAIALKDAGLSASAVQFEKAKLDREDGRLVYEIEFFIRGQKEYDYEIDAYTGKILDKEVEDWDD